MAIWETDQSLARIQLKEGQERDNRMNKKVRICFTLGFAVLALVFVRVVGRMALNKVALSVSDKK